ncbi:MAG: peptidoglycan DD-metalloendopeptidase family protein [Deltaproteobacteria bacterium]|nr:peptidoglycan DD-metalloendopeptidase family protein [Deltaproteobacteria bacterium]
MRGWPWIVGGGALAYALARRSSRRGAVFAGALPGRWVWPVPRWNDRAPAISDGFDSPRAGYPRHGGVDIMYPRASSDPFKAGTPNASKVFVMPDGISALAAADGVVRSAAVTPQGHAVVIDHVRGELATFYTHMERLSVKPGDTVRAGQPIGTIGASPLDKEHLKHLHFEIWLGGPSGRIDPAPIMRGWETVPSTTMVARNGGFLYRPVGAANEPYPEWVRALRGKAGVYVIRDTTSREIVYVGSSTTQLYDTLTRHFQTWRRWKGFWRGQYGEGHDPGLTYPRHRVEVAVRVTSPNQALDEEMRLIRKLKPRDNLTGVPALEEAPF